ncbi:MAG: M20 family metallopeptidase [Promethearchaeota archaeon]
MPPNEWEQKVLSRVDELRDELVKLCQDIIRIPSWDRETRGEAEVAHRVGKTMEKRGIQTEYVTSHPSIDNLVATWAAKNGKRLLFNGHVDVVPPGEDWTVDPFAAEIREGLIYGRGAMDMKGGVACMTMAMSALHDLEVPLKGSLIVNAVGDEERQGKLGTAYCIENAWKKIKADAAIVAEPSGIGQFGHAVNIGEKGPVWMKVTTKGEKAHGSIPSAGKNAIIMMFELLEALRQAKPPTIPPPITRKAIIHQFAASLNLEPEVMESFIEKGGESNPFSAGLEGLTASTMNIGTINGGVAANVVPDRCNAQIDFRILPGQTPQEMVEFIQHYAEKLGISEVCDIEIIEAFEGNSIPNYEQNKIVTTMFDASKEIAGPTVYFLVPYATDGRLLRRAGIESTVVYGPGNLFLAHTADENVAIEDLVKVTKVFALTAIRYLGVKDYR